jgi:hypothetical protein
VIARSHRCPESGQILEVDPGVTSHLLGRNGLPHLLCTLAVAMIASLLLASTAAMAAVRYAEPGGTGDPTMCLEENPCDIETAVEDASVMTGDEVIVLPGLHDIGTGELTVGAPGGKAIDVHGATGQPRPEITGTGISVVRMFASATIRDLEITGIPDGGFTAALRFDPNFVPTAERLLVFAKGSEVFACAPPLRSPGTAAVLRDSVCHAEGEDAESAGLGVEVGGGLPSAAEVVNVTAIGTNGASGIHLRAADADLTVNATNVIARSDTGIDVATESATAASSARVTLDHSNYATEQETAPAGVAEVTDPGSPTNQIAPPLFVNASTDFHQLAGSPTVDAGTAGDPLLGDFDFDMQQRVLGAAPDIGADELVPAPSPPPSGGGGSGGGGGAIPAAVPPSNAFEFGKLKRNKKKGIAFLFVNVPGPGEVGLAGKGVKNVGIASASARKSVFTPGGVVKLRIKPGKGKKARKLVRRLKSKGKAKLKVRVTYVPTGGTANTQARKVTLVRK